MQNTLFCVYYAFISADQWKTQEKHTELYFIVSRYALGLLLDYLYYKYTNTDWYSLENLGQNNYEQIVKSNIGYCFICCIVVYYV